MRRRDQGVGVEYKNDALFFKAAGAKRILTFNPHFHRKHGVTNVRDIEVVCLDAVPSMVDYAKKEYGIDKGEWLIVNPDLKPSRRNYDIALEFARYAKLPTEYLEMARSDGSAKIIQGDSIDAKGRNVIIVDDISSTFGTIETAIRHIKNPGRVYAMVVHCPLPREGLTKARNLLRDSDCPLKDIVATHTIDSVFSKISIHHEIVEYYRGSEKYR